MHTLLRKTEQNIELMKCVLEVKKKEMVCGEVLYMYVPRA